VSRPSKPHSVKERRARRWPEPHDSETFARACRVLRRADQLSWHDVSFVRAVAAIALTRSPAPEQSARLLAIARRVGVEP
jgi:hypothetical protein